MRNPGMPNPAELRSKLSMMEAAKAEYTKKRDMMISALNDPRVSPEQKMQIQSSLAEIQKALEILERNIRQIKNALMQLAGMAARQQAVHGESSGNRA